MTAALIVAPLCGQNAVEIVKKSIDNDFHNSDRQKDYTYQEREQDREFDSKGSVTKTESQTSEITVLVGQPYRKLIAKDDKPLPQKDAHREDEKMDRELSHRENMSPQDRANLEKKRQESRKFLREVPEAFHFTLAGEEKVSGRPAWVIDAEPNPDFKPKTMQARILQKIRGKVWIDQSEYQWVKADMHVLDAISLGLALFRIAPGGSIYYEQKRVNDEVWLPEQLRIRADARLAYVKKVRTEIDITYQDYRKFRSDAKMVSVAEK
ncbi:MAG TPA: hypothetical protein VMG40_15495 [Bryobacteraceae bacterium]|nr:hypothetical protein [Bryobacteraceae bacterium]